MKVVLCLVGGVASFVLGIFLWGTLLFAFGYPAQTETGNNIPSQYRLEGMSFAQWALEKCGLWIIPPLCSLLCMILLARWLSENETLPGGNK